MSTPFDEGQGQVTRRRRIWIGLPALLVLLIAAAAGAVWVWRLALAEHLMLRFAAAAGVELHEVTLDRLDFRGAAVSNFQVGPQGIQRIARARVTWTVAQLLRRRVGDVEIIGADVQAALAADGKLTIEGAPQMAGRSGQLGDLRFPANLPFRRIVVRSGQLAVSLPDGVIDLALDGQVETSAQSLQADVATTYTAHTQRGRGSGTGRAAIVWAAGGAPGGEFELAFDRLIIADLTGSGIRLRGRMGELSPRPEAVSLRAEGSADTIEASGLKAHDVRVAADLTDGLLDISGTGQIVAWAVAVSGQLRPFDLAAPARLTVRAEGDASTLSDHIATVSADGPISIELDAGISDPAAVLEGRERLKRDPLAIAEQISLRGSLDADLQRFAVADLLAAESLVGQVVVNWRRNTLDVDIRDGTRLTGIVLAPELSRALAELLPDAAPFAVVLTHGMASPPALRLIRRQDGFAIRAVGGVRLTTPAGEVVVEGDGTADVNADRGVERFEIPAFSATFDGVRTALGVADGALLITALSGVGDAISGVVDAKAALSDIGGGALSAQRIAFAGTAAVASTAEEASAILAPGSDLTVRELRLANGLDMPGTTRLRLDRGSHRLAFDRRHRILSGDIRLASGDTSVRVNEQNVALAYGPTAASGSWPGRLNVAVGRSSVVLDQDRTLKLRDLRVQADGEFQNAVMSVAANGVDAALPGLTLPAFDGRAEVTRRGASLDGTVELAAVGGQPTLSMQIAHNIETGIGRADISQAHLRFAPGILQPADLNPALATAVKNVFATLSLAGPIEWDASGALKPDLRLTIEGLAAASDKFELFDAGTTLNITAAPLLETAAGQRFEGRLRVGRLDPVPVSILFQLRAGPEGPTPILVVERITAEFADGGLTTDTFTVAPPSLDTDVTLRVENADIARLFSVLGTTGIGGTGRLDGTVPVRVRGNKVAITDGQLSSTGRGTIFYDIESLPQSLVDRDDTVSLVLQALSGFNYDELHVELNKALEGPGTLTMRLKGANPDVLENQPFDFNINFESNFDRLATLILEGLATSEGLLRALALPSNGGPVGASAR